MALEHDKIELIKHRRKGFRFELLVKRVGLLTEPTWESEETIQRRAPKVLYEYYGKLGGRDKFLLDSYRGKHLLKYYVFQILTRYENPDLCVIQWVGYPDTPPYTTREPITKIKRIAPRKWKEYEALPLERRRHMAYRTPRKKLCACPPTVHPRRGDKRSSSWHL